MNDTFTTQKLRPPWEQGGRISWQGIRYPAFSWLPTFAYFRDVTYERISIVEMRLMPYLDILKIAGSVKKPYKIRGLKDEALDDTQP